jgi:hypothetical protein
VAVGLTLDQAQQAALEVKVKTAAAVCLIPLVIITAAVVVVILELVQRQQAQQQVTEAKANQPIVLCI